MANIYIRIAILMLICVASVLYNYVIVFRPELFDRMHNSDNRLLSRNGRFRAYRIGGCIGFIFTMIFIYFLVREIVLLFTLL